MSKKQMTQTQPEEAFTGFPRGTFQFLQRLTKNNNRDWFANNKHHYEEFFVDPSLRFIKAMQPILEKHAPLLMAEAKKTGGSLMRIYRDTRFSKEKTPYKTNIGIQFRHELGRDVHSPGVYVHLDAHECFVGAGLWRPPSPALKALRQALDDAQQEWNRIVKQRAFRSNFEIYDDRLRTAPRGVAKDHPMLQDLRLKSFIAMAPMDREVVTSPQLLKSLEKQLKAARPWMEFLCAALDQPY